MLANTHSQPTMASTYGQQEKERALLSFVKKAAEIDLEQSPEQVMASLQTLRKEVPV